eukprot:11097709-Karenia_brevis.AAC.1
MGGRLSPHKSKLFSTVGTHRNWLRTYTWDIIEQAIPVVHHMRDLGASLCTTLVKHATMSHQRFQNALKTIYKIHKLPH